MQRVAIGLLGLGTVNAGVCRLLDDAAERVSRRAGARIEPKWAVVRDPSRPRACGLSQDRIGTDHRRVIDDPEIRIVVEAIGGVEPARTWILQALAAGKDVVTANKALLADHGAEIFAQARKYGRAVAFEASVAGGIPIVQGLGVGLAANQITGLAAIVNGTCNFILSSMGVSGVSYDAALTEAQHLGYAEADPTLDVDGTDTAHKLAILAQIAFGATVTTRDIPREGIDRLQAADIRYARELGYTVKLLALAKLTDSGLELRVAPTLVRRGTPLAEVKGPYNAVRVVGDAVGDTLFYGRGAGGMPTASSIVADLIDVHVGRAALTFRSLDFWPADAPPPILASPIAIRSRYYLRFSIADRPGVIGSVAQILGQHGISIASVIQHDPGDDDHPEAPVPLVIMTHSAVDADVAAAVDAIDQLDAVRAPSVRLGVEE